MASIGAWQIAFLQVGPTRLSAVATGNKGAPLFSWLTPKTVTPSRETKENRNGSLEGMGSHMVSIACKDLQSVHGAKLSAW